jgi:hypothetical protein
MLRQRTLLLLGIALLGGTWTARQAHADDPKKEPEKKSGTVTGTLTAKGETWIEVKADGEEKARRYTPHWVGGAPAQGGGFDKAVLQTIRGLKVNSRVRLEWDFEERPRVVKVEVLKEAATEPKPEAGGEARKEGTVTGTLTAKEENKWVEVKADGEEKGRRYFLHHGGTRELLQAIKDTPVGSRVRIKWLFNERPRVVKLEVIKAADKNP